LGDEPINGEFGDVLFRIFFAAEHHRSGDWFGVLWDLERTAEFFIANLANMEVGVGGVGEPVSLMVFQKPPDPICVTKFLKGISLSSQNI
jgi:hypothetical protein